MHVLLGYTVLGLVAFRLLWGLFGTRYARFWSFAYGPKSVLSYVKSLFSRSPQHFVGHNPAGSWAIYGLLALSVLAGASGYATYNDIGGRWMEDVHEALANTLLGLVFVHITGVVLSSRLHRENLVRSMLNGYKCREVGGRNPLPPSPGRRRTRRGSGRTLDRRAGLAARGMDASGARGGGREIPIGGPKARRLKPLRLRRCAYWSSRTIHSWATASKPVSRRPASPWTGSRTASPGNWLLRTESHAAVVLDLGLPRLAGLDVLRHMRAEGNKTPVLILTARDAIEDRIKGLDSGADDYMVKPFDLHELAARLRALIRRSAGEAAPVLRVRDIELDPAARRVQFKGRLVALPAREYALLHAFMLSAGRVLTREQLSERLYAWGEEVESNAIDVHIHHLRRKLAPPADPHGARRGLSHATRAEWIAARRIH